MEQEPSLNESMIEAALAYLRLGYRPIPLVRGTKRPSIKTWTPYRARPPTEIELFGWFGHGQPNIALVTGIGVVVVDVDDPDLVDAVIEHCGPTPMQTITPRGGRHLWYRMRGGVHYGSAVKIKNRPLDLRCEGSYIVVPWSRNDKGMAYQYAGSVLPAADLPLMRVSWLRERKPRRIVMPVEVSDNVNETIRRARAYLAYVEGSISGCGGHNQAMRAAGVLCQKFGLSVEEALPLFLEWSEKTCKPPWSVAEAIHKLSDAVRLRAERGLRPIT